MPDRRISALLLGLVLVAFPVIAEEAPDPEMLEFLGEFSDGEDGWTDPETLMMLDEEVIEALASETNANADEDDREDDNDG